MQSFRYDTELFGTDSSVQSSCWLQNLSSSSALGKQSSLAACGVKSKLRHQRAQGEMFARMADDLVSDTYPRAMLAKATAFHCLLDGHRSFARDSQGQAALAKFSMQMTSEALWQACRQNEDSAKKSGILHFRPRGTRSLAMTLRLLHGLPGGHTVETNLC